MTGLALDLRFDRMNRWVYQADRFVLIKVDGFADL